MPIGSIPLAGGSHRLSPACDSRDPRYGGGHECPGRGARCPGLEVHACPPWEGGGVVEAGLWGYTSLLSSSAPCVGWGTGGQGFGTLPSPPLPHTAGPPEGRGEWEGRGGLFGQAPGSASLGTLPEAPETMLGVKAAWPERAWERHERCPLHSQARPLTGPRHPFSLWAPCPVPGFCSPTPWRYQPCRTPRRPLSYPAPS